VRPKKDNALSIGQRHHDAPFDILGQMADGVAHHQSINRLCPINQSPLYQRATLPKVVVIARPCCFPEVPPLAFISRGLPLAFKHRQPFDSAEQTIGAHKRKMEE